MSFRPGVIPTVAAAAAVVVLCSLGAWQVRRHHWKQALLADFTQRLEQPPAALADALADPAAHEFRRVRVVGRYDLSQSVLLLHVRRGLAEGARVLTPLRPAERPGSALLVDRGWIPLEEVETFPDADRSPEPVEVVGVLRALDLAGAAPRSPASRRVRWNRLRPELLQAQIPYPLAPLLLVREDDGTGRLPLGGVEPPRSRVDHRGYALTWFALAAIALATWVGLGVSQGRRGTGPPAPPAP